MTTAIKILQLDAFTNRSMSGNPAGVVPDAEGLTDEEMQLIAREMNCSETAFVTPSQVADFRVRFFSPAKEVGLCGHATVATFHALASSGAIPLEDGITTVTQETNVGVLPVHIHSRYGIIEKVMMEQSPPEIRRPDIGAGEIAAALNIGVDEINSDLPVLDVSTGNTSLKAPVLKLATVQRMRPDFEKVLALSKKADVGSIHVFTFETLKEESTAHNRNFAPYHGVNEDPVTGTASGSLAAYLIHNRVVEPGTLIMEQGYELNRPGRVIVEIDAGMKNIRVGGAAVQVLEGEIRIR